MSWYYAGGGKQIGPVTDADIDFLVREGVIQPATLVWREGMGEWQPWSSVASTRATPSQIPVEPSAAPGQVTCIECRRPVPAEETVRIGDAVVCPACKPRYVQKLREGAATLMAAEGMRYAGFWIRAAAFIFDYVIITIITLPLGIWFQLRMNRALQGGQLNWEEFLPQLVLSSAWSTFVAVTYGWLFVGRYAATPGKMILKLKVVTADGGRVSYLRSLGRQGAHIVSQIPCLIGYLLPLFDDQKRALHDHICNTRVIHR
jgi:uncharacterized RDD family membrane protein YckC/DNA-directed RNA polymerase subunit RPC12/RpoP